MSDFSASAADANQQVVTSAWIGNDAESGLRNRRYGAVFACVAVFFLSAYADILNGFAGVAIISIAVLFAFPHAGRSSLASTLVLTAFAIYMMPYIGLIYADIGVQTAWFALFVVVGVAMTVYAEPMVRADSMPGHNWADLPLIAVYLVGGLLLWSGEGLRQVSFYAGWAAALVHLERMHVQSRSLIYRAIGLLAFAAVIGYFVAVLWSGSGRIVQLSFALAPLLLAVHYRTFRLNGLFIGVAAVVLSLAGRLLRFGWSDGLAGLAVDSGASPITITSYLWSTKDIVLATGSVLDQWILLFVNWFPRELWPDKPIGIGSTFVDLVLGRQGFSAEHNLAIGFVGEHIFFLPNAWPISVGLLIVVMIVLRRLMVQLFVPYRAPVIIFDVWLITFFWGGMAAFAARVWLALIPVVPYVLLIRWLDRRSGKVAVRPVEALA